MLAIIDEYIYLKIARALSSSEVQYFTSTLTRLEKVWYSVFAAWNGKSRVFEEKYVNVKIFFAKSDLFCRFVDSFKDVHVVLVNVFLLVLWRGNRRGIPAR